MNKRNLQSRRALRFALLVLLLSVAGTRKLCAYDFSATGPSGQILYCNIIEGADRCVALTYPGTSYYNPWYSYPKPKGHLVLPVSVINNGVVYAVKSIEARSFADCDSLVSVEIPNSVVSVGYEAFYGTGWYDQQPDGLLYLDGWCLGYKGDFPTGVLRIESTTRGIAESAFSYCDELTGNLTIPNSVTIIGKHAFYECSGFTGYLTLSNFVTSIGSGAFEGCSGFTGDLTIPNSVTTIGDHAFEGCSGFTGGLTIPNSVTYLGANAFYDCNFNGLDINMPHIPDMAFIYCEGFTGNLTIGGSVTTIGSYAFYGCGDLGSLTIGSSVISVGESAFDECYFHGLNINMVDIPGGIFGGCGFWGHLTLGDSVVTIGNGAFSGKGFSGNLIIPNSVTSIGSSAFYECYGFTGSLTIPNSVTSLGENAFYGCAFDGLNINIPTIPEGAFDGCEGFTGTLTIGNSVTTIGSSAFAVCSGFTGDLIIPESVTSIGNYAFTECSGFTGDLIIPNSVITIGDHAFSLCEGFTGDLVIGNSVTTIGNHAFSKGYSDGGFTGSLTLGSSVTTIGSYAFFNDFTGILTIPNSVTSIGEHAFESCHFTGLDINMTNIPDGFMGNIKGDFSGQLTIGDSVTTIGSHAFSDSDNFTGNLIIPNSVVTIGDYAFAYNGFTGDLVIPNSVISIGERAFFNCSGFSGSLNIGNSVTTIGSYAFFGCNGFGNLSIGNSVTLIDDYAFFRCDGFSGRLTIPNSVISIGEYAFYECTGFTEGLTIGNSVSTIGRYAFYRLGDFSSSLTIPSSVTSIANGAFNECSFDGLNVDMTNIPDGFMSVIEGSFSGSLNIGNSVTTIGNQAFSGCYGFRGDLSIPNSVTSIGSQAFAHCYGFTSVHSYGAVPPSTGSNAFDYMDSSIPVYVPFCSASDYSQTNPWSSFTDYRAVLPCPYTFTGNGTDNLWSNPDNWHTLPANDYDIVINSTCEMDEDVEASGIIINNIGTLVVKSGHVLTVNGDANRSDDALAGEIVNHGTAANLIIEDGGQLVYDKDGLLGTIKKDISGYALDGNDGWHFVSCPIFDSAVVSSVVNMLDDNYDLYYYDEPTHQWMNQKDETGGFTRLNIGQGYLYANQAGTTLNFAGQLNASNPDVSIPITYTNSPLAGLNLVGNPFTCNAYLQDENNNPMPFFKMNDTGDTLVAAQAGTPIKPCEGVFVICPNDGQAHFAVFTTTAPSGTGQVQSVPGVLLPIHDLLINQDACGAVSSVTQTVTLSAGINWFSTNVEITLDDLKTALVAALPETAITIKGKAGSIKYVVRTHKWNGTLVWDITNMYKIEVPNACEITLVGMSINSAEHPVTISPNTANWIGYPLNNSMTLSEAFAGFGAVTGDVIQSKGGSARYRNGSWRPNGLTTLAPGQGYIYKSAATGERILVFPSGAK